MFAIGDKVRCKTPTGGLHKDCVYTIDNVILPVAEGASINNTMLQLKEVGDRVNYYAFRFEIATTEDVKFAENTQATLGNLNLLPAIEDKKSTIIAPGAAKNDSDKIDLSLIPKISNIEHARAFMVGEKKYGRYNYCKGHKASQLVAAAKRHLDAWFECEDHDPVDGQHHLGSVMACCSMILRQEELGTLTDDRYYKPGTEEV